MKRKDIVIISILSILTIIVGIVCIKIFLTTEKKDDSKKRKSKPKTTPKTIEADTDESETPVSSAPATLPPAPTKLAPAPATLPPAPTKLAPAPATLPPAPTTLPPAPTTLPPATTTLPPAPTSFPPAPTSLPPAPTISDAVARRVDAVLTKSMKNDFFEATFQDEKNKMNTTQLTKLPSLLRLYLPDLAQPQNLTCTPILRYAKDSAAEVFEFLKKGYKVGANTAANAFTIGGGFTTKKDLRNGRGSQEEGFFALFDGLLRSLAMFAVLDSRGFIYEGRQGRWTYKPSIFPDNIIKAYNIKSRIKMKLFDDFKADNLGFTFFTDYVAYRYYLDKDIFTDFNDETFEGYIIPSLDRRGSDIVNYNDLKVYIKEEIKNMLLESKFDRDLHLVITVPGSGVFANMSYDDNAARDTLYLDAVEKGVASALKEYGRGIIEIVICGHRYEPLIDFA